MKKNSTHSTYDPKLPNQVWIERESGHSDLPKHPAKNPGTTSPTAEELKKGNKSAQSDVDDEIANRAEAALTTQGEEMRPRDGNLDGGTAR
ncbi:MAG: hypothetical protein ACR2IE_02680 [Candidatus Sumerlaeaceae bacterium]